MNRIDVKLEFKKSKPEWKSALFHDGDKDVWLPKSQIAIRRHKKSQEPIGVRECVTVNLPEWLAKEKELI